MKRMKLMIPLGLLGIFAVVFLTNRTQFDLATANASLLFAPDSTEKFAQIKMDEEIFDFKDIEQNTKVSHTFFIKNTGNDTLRLIDIRPSCGCTGTVLDNKSVPPGGISRLKVEFDANNKGEGPVTKSVTITSNSKEQAEKHIRFTGKIVKSKTTHKATMMHLDGVFQGDCASCHVEKGKGELGARLFDADCGICHGAKADGKPAVELASDQMMKKTPKQWKKIIEDGIPNSNMPAFHTRNKGPLGDEEIASLIEYMSAFKKELARQKTLKSTAPTGSVK